ncbi:MAG: HAMP domain-containing protein [Treponema sp.]|jgi:signal transduction histidine kinase|nr:HAMP domain-containing protein [Treponema sp.]
MISLRNYLTLVYALFICVSVFVLSIVINSFAGKLFSDYIKDTIDTRNREIIQTFTDHYDPRSGRFDVVSLEAMGMYFMHQGYIISLEDMAGNLVWDARSCDMTQCAMVADTIVLRMENHQLNGAFENSRYTLTYGGSNIAQLNIETYGPFFYSESESAFLTALNRFLFAAGMIVTLLSIVISIILATALSRPILQAADAARRIAGGNRTIRIPDKQGARELHELSQAVNELAAALEEGERRQKRLTSDIAHELRTPLTTLQGNVEAMIDGVWKPTPERLASCHEEVIRLTKLVEDLNTLTNLEWDTLTLNKTDFDLSKLLQSTVEQFMPAAQEKGISLKVNLPASPITADYDRLKQVFINLLSNAIKYTDCGNVTVDIERGVQNWAVTVADTGIGIPESEIPHIFERFYRSDKSRNRSTGGAGIGLTIATAIVAAHGGSISVESENGKGSVFTVAV